LVLEIKDEPAYPFGSGISYTQFVYDKLKITPTTIDPGGCVTVSANVKNIGDRSGDEVVQLYLRDVHASVARPIKALKGFDRISLQPGESKVVNFSLPAKSLSFWEVKKKAFVIEPGVFEVQVGSSSTDIRMRGSFTVK